MIRGFDLTRAALLIMPAKETDVRETSEKGTFPHIDGGLGALRSTHTADTLQVICGWQFVVWRLGIGDK